MINYCVYLDYLLSELMTARLLKIKIEDSTEYKRHNFDVIQSHTHFLLSLFLLVQSVRCPI